MSWIEPISTAVAAASIGADFVRSSPLLSKHVRRFAYRMKNGTALIPVFGAGGVGKSTFGRLIDGRGPLDVAVPYKESWFNEKVKLHGNVPGYLLIGPGQPKRAERHWPALLGRVVSGKVFGMINVVAYGYHALGIESFREHDLYAEGMSEVEFMSVFSTRRRAVELEFLESVLGGITAIAQPLWMITIVNKQDLWWDDRVTVRRHYEDGHYQHVVEEFAASHGARNFQHEMFPVSLTISNLETQSGECLAATTAGYDLTRHTMYLRSLFERFNDTLSAGLPD